MYRLTGFDYSSPYYYMVTLKKREGLAPFSRVVEGSAECLEWLAKGRRLGPGSAAVGTILSPCEKATRDEILAVGGNLIALEPQSYAERGHPPREYEALCANGRALFLSLWPADTKKLDRATMYTRCHELGDIAVEGLG